MSEIDNKIYLKKKELQYRLVQVSTCEKKIKSYYSEQVSILKEEILNLEALKIYNLNTNESNIVDIHGATKYFIEYYLEDLIYFKSQYNIKIKLITGKGTFTLFNLVKKFLLTNKIPFKIDNYCFEILLN